MGRKARHRLEREKSSISLKQLSAVCLVCGLAASAQVPSILEPTLASFNSIATSTASVRAEAWIVASSNPSAKSTTVITVSWPQTGSYTSYLLQWSTTSDFATVNSATVTGLAFDVTALTSATKYYFRVRPVGSPTGTWSTPTSTTTIYTPIDTKYAAVNGPTLLGAPIEPNEVSIRDGGFYRCYPGGCILYSPAYGTFLSLNNPIRTKWANTGYEGGYLGYPKSDEIVDANGGKKQNFEGGIIVLESGKTAAFSVRNGTILNEYLAGGIGKYFYPIAEQVAVAKNSGYMQSFTNSDIYWSSATSAHSIFRPGGIGQTWANRGGISGLGYPTSEETGGMIEGGYKQSYEAGAIYWTPTYGGYVMMGGIGNDWKAAGAETSRFGYPVSNEYSWSGLIRQDFQRGYITWNSSTGSSFYYY